jgi:dehydrogenase/reductase SDR family member 12
VLEATVVGSFSRVGYLVRRRLWTWSEPAPLTGRIMLVTGASSGVGREVALGLGQLGADLWLVGRDPERTAEVGRAALSLGAASVDTATLDLTDAGSVAALVDRVEGSHDQLQGLVHGAGALLAGYVRAADGTEATVATHVLAPFRLSQYLSPLLRRAGSATIVTVSSGGMYTQPFDLSRLEMDESAYDGMRAYARAKRAQVVLSHEWARRWAIDGVASYAMHPGWAATPGLAAGLPVLARLGPLLRTPAEGADTAVWLAADSPRREAQQHGQPPASIEGFWLDRRPRPEYRWPGTRPEGDGDDDGPRLWAWCAERCGTAEWAAKVRGNGPS